MIIVSLKEIITFSSLQNLSSEFNLEACHQVSANVIHESVVCVTCDIQVQEECNTTWNDDYTFCKFRDIHIQISPGLTDDGFRVIRLRVALAFKPKPSRGFLLGFNTSEIACDILF